jgi:serine/threonine protein kinase
VPFLPLSAYGKSLGELGAGAFGTVTLHVAPDALYSTLSVERAARLRLGDGKVALKVSKKLDGAIERGNVREIAALERLDHPNVVELLDVIVEEGVFGLVEPSAEGGSLSGFLKDKARRALLPLNGEYIARTFSYQLARGVQYMLGRDVWHRDLKPGNLLLYKEYLDRERVLRLDSMGWKDEDMVSRLVIADLGLSRVGMCSAVGDPHSGVIGTMRYMSPEVMLGGTYTGRSEVWSVGVIVAELFLPSGALFRSIELPDRKPYRFFPSISSTVGEPVEVTVMLSAVTSTTTPAERVWPGLRDLPYLKDVPPRPDKLTDEANDWLNRTGRFSVMPVDVHALLRRMLSYDPLKRPSIDEVLSSACWDSIREYVEVAIPAPPRGVLTCSQNLLVAEPPLPDLGGGVVVGSGSGRVPTPTETLVSTILTGTRIPVRLRSAVLACHLLIWYPQVRGSFSVGAALHLATVIHDRSSSRTLESVARLTGSTVEGITHAERALIRDTGGRIAPSTILDIFRALSRDKVYTVMTRKVGSVLSVVAMLTPLVYTHRVRDIGYSVLVIACRHTKATYRGEASVDSLPVEELLVAMRKLLASSIPNLRMVLTTVATPLKVDVESLLSMLGQ